MQQPGLQQPGWGQPTPGHTARSQAGETAAQPSRALLTANGRKVHVTSHRQQRPCQKPVSPQLPQTPKGMRQRCLGPKAFRSAQAVARSTQTVGWWQRCVTSRTHASSMACLLRDSRKHWASGFYLSAPLTPQATSTKRVTDVRIEGLLPPSE